MIGRIAPKALNGHEYILVANDYFIKWVEAASYTVLMAKHVARFLENNIICRFRVPREIMIMVLTLMAKSEGSWKSTTLSIISFHHINHKLMGP